MNTAHLIAYALDGALMIAIPVGIAWWLHRRFGARWNTWLIGMLAFVTAQVVHAPLLGIGALFTRGNAWGVSSAVGTAIKGVWLGLAAGVCEEVARYIFLRYVARYARAWRDGAIFGAGHGGIEAMMIGAGVLLQIPAMTRMSPEAISALPADQQAAVQQQVDAFWSAPLWHIQLGWIERAFALCLHIACALLVLEAVRRRRMIWLFAAIAWHALTDACTVWFGGLSPVALEAILGVFAVASVAMAWWLRRLDTPEDLALSDAAPVRGQGDWQQTLRAPSGTTYVDPPREREE